MTRRTRVYVAGPLSTGDRRANVQKAMDVGRELIQAGFAPLVPHLTDFLDPTDALGWETWIDVDLVWVAVSDALLRLPGDSRGADREVAHAESLGIPVYHSIDDLKAKPPQQGDHRFHAALREMGLLHNRKSADYGLGEDPLANVRASEEFGIPGWLGVALRLNDKMVRVKSMARKGYLLNESLEDSFKDISAYGLIALILYREQQKAEPCPRNNRASPSAP